MEPEFPPIQLLPQAARQEAYVELLSKLLEPIKLDLAPPGSLEQTSVIQSVSQFVGKIVQDSIGLLISKSVLGKLVEWIDRLRPTSEDHRPGWSDFKRRLIEDILGEPNLSSRSVRFEELLTKLRVILADILEEQEDWSEAAQVLKAIPLDSSHCLVAEEYKLKIYIRIVRLLLEDDDAISAEIYLNRASLLIPNTKDETTVLSIKLAQARVFDSKRKFEEASKRYHEISLTNLDLADEEREHCLSASVLCAILAQAGPSRTRLLRDLFRDDRTKELDDFRILSKMFFDQIIRSEELIEFEKRLKPHHLARLGTLLNTPGEEDQSGEGHRHSDLVMEEAQQWGKAKQGPETVFDRAIMQHNLLSASKIYNHISFKGLGMLLGLTPSAAEEMARIMIQEKRLRGSIDQVVRIISFENHSAGGDEELVVSNVAIDEQKNSSSGQDKLNSIQMFPETIKWDEAIRQTCQKVEMIHDHIISANLLSPS